MPWVVQLAGPAQKQFARLPAKDQLRVKAALLAMEEDPFRGDAAWEATESSTISISSGD